MEHKIGDKVAVFRKDRKGFGKGAILEIEEGKVWVDEYNGWVPLDDIVYNERLIKEEREKRSGFEDYYNNNVEA